MRRRLPDLLILALLFALPLLTFWNQTVGGRTLLPAENLYQYEPYATYREVVKAPAIPYNHLVSDLVLQNFQWKSFLRQQIADREIPLWNPYQFSGIAFLAAGQHSALYPFSLLYYLLDLPAAYGWFTVVQLWLAGAFMFAFARGLGISRAGGAAAAVTYQLAAFFVISAVFPMIIAAAVWLPLLLLMIEYVIRHQPLAGRPVVLPWIAIGAAALGCNILAGHVEITYYTLLVAAYYAAARLLFMLWTLRRTGHKAGGLLRELVGRGAALIALITLGGALGAVQFIPLFEAASNNFRAQGAPFDQVLGWAHPLRDAVQFVMPNFYGSPAHHTYFDVFDLRTVSLIDETVVNAAGGRIVHTEWGMKNYVEAALYVGILPLILAGIALLDAWGLHRHKGTPHRLILAVLALGSLTFMFGLPTYAVLYYTLPGIDQLHSPFRWVFPFTFAVAALAGFGMDAVLLRGGRWSRRIGYGLAAAGGLILAGLVASRLFYDQAAPLVERLYGALAKAVDAFSDARMFYSYQFVNAAVFAVMLIASGAVVILLRRPHAGRAGVRGFAPLLAVAVIAADLMIASAHFNPASDPALLDFTPPSIQWLMEQLGEWRYTTIEEAGKPALFNANLTMRYGLQDIRGYESIIPAGYIQAIFYPQTQLEFNRVSPIPIDQINNGELCELRRLGVRYIITHDDMPLPSLSPLCAGGQTAPIVYADEAVKIYQVDSGDRIFAFGQTRDIPRPRTPPILTRISSRELQIDATTEAPASIIIREYYDGNWRAYLRPQGAPESEETQLALGSALMFGLIADISEPGDWTIRLVYSPASFQVGLFASFIGGVILLLLVGAWAWRGTFGGVTETGLGRIARNSIAPILLNLFNRGIDMAFALVMLRILGPTDAGWYFYAGVIFVWFDIFTNFGLNLYLTREVARDRSRARPLFVNTSALRILLAAVGVPALIAFFALRQGVADPPLTGQVILAISILYIGLLPNSLSTGFTSLFYAFERAELPAAVATAATINKVALGLGVLLMGWGFVGLAAVSILTNLLTLAILGYYGRSLIAAPPSAGTKREPSGLLGLIDRSLMRRMMGESAPLLFNHFLATLFFQIDVVIIEALRGAEMVGQYSVAYKWLTALNVIPSFFTQALLPRMSRLAHEDRAALARDYVFAVKLMLSLALPTAVFFTFTAYFWAGFLGGAEFLPDGAIATQLMMWSIPIGWMNSLTQYTLIALDLQRRLTRAFAAAVIFNIAGNLIFVPQYGYQAAAVITIFSEGVLFAGFVLLLRQGLGGAAGIDWLQVVARPLAAAALMFALMAVGFASQPALTLAASVILYIGTLLALGTFDREELSRLLPLLPGRLRAAAARL
ncbi:MAG: oligosaccharide flippase family protein [Anaerolineae bacterium]|nr:oligosaccharide flippase family protein [Anaerolineae bacterium]